MKQVHLLFLLAAYLFYRKVLTPIIPFIYILSFAIFALIFGGHGFDMNYILGHILSGGLILGAFSWRPIM